MGSFAMMIRVVLLLLVVSLFVIQRGSREDCATGSLTSIIIKAGWGLQLKKGTRPGLNSDLSYCHGLLVLDQLSVTLHVGVSHLSIALRYPIQAPKAHPHSHSHSTHGP